MRALCADLGCLPVAARPLALWQRSTAPTAVDLTRRSSAPGLSAALGQRRHASPRRRAADLAIARATAELYPFNESDYYRVKLQVVAAGIHNHGGQAQVNGNIVLIREEDHLSPTPESQVLLLAVSGDAVLALTRLMNHGAYHKERPLSMDLLWALQQQRESVQSDFKLLRVAVVDLQSFAYMGRLFFGDPTTGEHTWDCDCRPSDSFWLAMRSRCPMFVRKDVWNQNSQVLKALAPGAAVHSTDQPPEELSGIAAATTLRAEDPEPLKLLKRQLAVAIGEEDYQQAARLRDHPYMALHLEAMRMRLAGRPQEASGIQQRLSALIDTEASRIQQQLAALIDSEASRSVSRDQPAGQQQA